MRRAEESSADSHTCEIWISCCWLLYFSFFHFLSILSSPSPQAKLHQCQLQQSQSTLLLSNFPPLTQYDVHTLISNMWESFQAALQPTLCWRFAWKSLFFFETLRLGSVRLIEPSAPLNKVEMKLERKRKKAISLIKRWFFTVDRLSWS